MNHKDLTAKSRRNHAARVRARDVAALSLVIAGLVGGPVFCVGVSAQTQTPNLFTPDIGISPASPQPAPSVVYFDDFTTGPLGVSLNGHRPRIDPSGDSYLVAGLFGGNDIVYEAGDARSTGTDVTTALLPFTPSSTGISAISLDVTPGSNPLEFPWIGIGFTPTSRAGSAWDGGPWELVSMAGGFGSFAGPGVSNFIGGGVVPGFTGTAHVLVTYNASTKRADFVINGQTVSTHVYGSTPSISHVFVSEYSGTFVFGSGTFTNLLVTRSGQSSGRLWYRNGFPGVAGDAKAIAMDSHGNVLATSVTQGGASGLDFQTVKYDAVTGATLWVRHYNGPGNGDDIPAAAAVDSHGDLFVTGRSAGLSSSDDYVTMKLDGATGKRLWVERYTGSRGNSTGPDSPRALTVDAADNLIVTGSSFNDATQSLEYATVKYNGANGATFWSRLYPGTGIGGSVASGVAADGAGNVFVTGRARRADGLDYIETLKYDGATGATLWRRTFSPPPYSVSNSGGLALDVPSGGVRLALDASGNPVLAATLLRVPATLTDPWDIKVWKYDGATGADLWSRRYDGGAADDVEGLGLDHAGNAYVTANSFGGGPASDGFLTLRFEADSGHCDWARVFPTANQSTTAPLGQREGPRALVVDRNADVIYVGGSSDEGSGIGDRYRAIAYGATTGNQLWTDVFAGSQSVNASDFIAAMALDPSGALAVTGTREIAGSDSVFATIKYICF